MATVGKTTPGSSSSASTADKIAVSSATAADTGTLTSGTARLWLSAAASPGTMMLVYADSGGAPGALLAQSAQVTVTQIAAADVNYTFTGGNQITITSGVTYWIGVFWQDPGTTQSVNLGRDSVASGRQEVSPTWPTPPNPFGVGTVLTGPIDAYLTFTVGGGGGGGAAAPVFQTAGSALAGASGNTAPIPVPPGVQVNDIILADVYKEVAGAVTPPSGFAEVAAVANVEDAYLHKFWKRATAADSGVYTFSWSTSNWRAGFATRVSGCVTSGTPYEDFASAASATATGASPGVQVDTLGANRLLMWSASAYSGGTWTPPTGFTEHRDGDYVAGAHQQQAAQGSSGTVSGTVSSTAKRCAWLLALVPPATASAASSTRFLIAGAV